MQLVVYDAKTTMKDMGAEKQKGQQVHKHKSSTKEWIIQAFANHKSIQQDGGSNSLILCDTKDIEVSTNLNADSYKAESNLEKYDIVNRGNLHNKEEEAGSIGNGSEDNYPVPLMISNGDGEEEYLVKIETAEMAKIAAAPSKSQPMEKLNALVSHQVCYDDDIKEQLLIGRLQVPVQEKEEDDNTIIEDKISRHADLSIKVFNKGKQGKHKQEKEDRSGTHDQNIKPTRILTRRGAKSTTQ